jgi:hypothetical protein
MAAMGLTLASKSFVRPNLAKHGWTLKSWQADLLDYRAAVIWIVGWLLLLALVELLIRYRSRVIND